VKRAAFLLIILLVMQAIAPIAQACAVCYGAPDDPMTKGMNNGIWVLLGVIGFVQIGFVAMFWSFWKRAREQRRFKEQFRVIHSPGHSSYTGGPQV
jgi:hypothetical protein